MIHQDRRNSLAGWDFTADELLDAISAPRMLNPSIDLTNACNLNCPYCYIEEKESRRKVRHHDELSHSEVLAIIDDLHSCGAKTINIVGAGEPTIDPHVVETISYISGLGMRVVLFTNGIKLSRDIHFVDFLHANGASVVLKFNSQDATTQDLVAGARGYSIKRDRALELLIDSGFNATEPTRLGVDIIVFSGNYAELVGIHRWCRDNNIYPIAGEYIPSGRTELGSFQGFSALASFPPEDRATIADLLQPITPDQRHAVLKQVAALDLELGIERDASFAYVGGGVCTQILGVYIDIAGNIWPCVARSIAVDGTLRNGLLGNTRRGDSPSKIWNTHPYMEQIRKRFDGGCPYKAQLTQVVTLRGT
jgi:MoaA/NifB/PqqE/SkfB family radical SAM enzyme